MAAEKELRFRLEEIYVTERERWQRQSGRHGVGKGGEDGEVTDSNG